MAENKRKKVIIMGAAGRDFHDFNMHFKDNKEFEVKAFTQNAKQNLGVLSKKPHRYYPKELAGKLYKKGIPIYSEKILPELIKKFDIEEVVFSYSDNSHEHVMHKASQALAAGANFVLLGAKAIMIKSKKPVIAVCAVRTGCGKSQTSRRICEILKKLGKKTVAIREPMPYGDLRKQVSIRFASYKDLEENNCTIEEREEYEPYIEEGFVIYAGVDYKKILRSAEKEAQVIVWDGGNNELSFYKPDLLVVVTDPFRLGHETLYHPGETNLLMADVVLINKVNSAPANSVKKLEENISRANPKAKILKASSVISLNQKIELKGKKVLCVEDGPTVTHGGMGFGAAFTFAENHKAKIVDPKPYAVGSIKNVFSEFAQLEKVLPAMGYSKGQLKELEKTINAVPCDLVLAGTPIDLAKIVKTNKRVIRVKYALGKEVDLELKKLIQETLKKKK
ncbi:MAG: GTPase [Candidatus Diapherotrites archaeon]